MRERSLLAIPVKARPSSGPERPNDAFILRNAFARIRGVSRDRGLVSPATPPRGTPVRGRAIGIAARGEPAAPVAPNPHFARIGGEDSIRRLTQRFYEAMDRLPGARGIRAMHPADLRASRERDAWLHCMDEALEAVVEDAALRAELRRAFRKTADAVRNR